MKTTVPGSLGHISKSLTQSLIQQEHLVTVISSKAERQKDIEALGASAAIGTTEDVDFLSSAFKGADIVYVMETPGINSFFDHDVDFVAALTRTGNNYGQAI